MKIMLLNAPNLTPGGVIQRMYPPLGLLYLAACARERGGAEVRVEDGVLHPMPELLARIRDFSPDVVGLTFTTQSSTGAYAAMNAIKAEADIEKGPLLLAGGPHATAMPEEILARSSCDIVVRGEGEETLLEIMERRRSNSLDPSRIKGVAYSDSGEIKLTPKRELIRDLDDLPLPARDLLDLSAYPGYYYKKGKRETYMTSARGCPYNCLYCSNPVWKENKPWYRLRSPKRVVDEIEHLVNDLGYDEIYDQTDEFNANLDWAKAVCDEIAARGIKVHLKAQLRSDRMDRELAEKMKRAGFWLALFGVESGNDRTLRGVRKRVKVEDHLRTLRLVKSAGLKTFALLMAFNVWEEDGELCFEDREATQRTLDFARRLVKEGLIDLMSWSLTTPYPGSGLYDLALRRGLIPKEMVGRWEQWDSSERMLMSLPGVSLKDWVDVQNAGKRLQFRLLLTSGAFNWRSFPMYFRRGLSQAAKFIRSRLRPGG